jgi:uncharacterized membrane protein
MPNHTEAFMIFMSFVAGVFFLSGIVLRKNTALAIIPASVLVLLMFIFLGVLFIAGLYFNAFEK